MTSNHQVAVSVALVLATLSLPVPALQPLITDDTGTQGSGGNQIEASYTGQRSTSAGATDKADGIAATYTRGVGEDLDLFVTGSYLRLRPAGSSAAYGAGTPSIGAKWRFMGNDEDDTRLGVKPEIFFRSTAAGARPTASPPATSRVA